LAFISLAANPRDGEAIGLGPIIHGDLKNPAATEIIF